MKCDELKAKIQITNDERMVYLKADVDAAIDELKTEHHKERDEYISMVHSREQKIKELEAKLEDAKASAYAESVDAGMRERRLRRALYLANAYKAKFKRWWLHLALDCEASMIRPDTKTINRIRRKIGNCEKSERKCRAKAESYL